MTLLLALLLPNTITANNQIHESIHIFISSFASLLKGNALVLGVPEGKVHVLQALCGRTL